VSLSHVEVSHGGEYRPRPSSIALCLFAMIVVAILMIGCGGGGNSQGPPPPPPPPPGPNSLGTVSNEKTVPCSQVNGDGGVAGGTCHQLTISCPGVADEDVALKVNTPGNSVGTVLFTVGGGGDLFYDVHFAYGTQLINQVITAGFTTAQFSFQFVPVGFPPGGVFAGWLTGPGGPRKTVCRWATAAKWIHDNIRSPNTAFCATGNSGGSGAAAYAIAHYGLDSIFDMLEETSGPPFSRLDHGCICNAPLVDTPCISGGQDTCYLNNANLYIDPSYDPLGHICSSAEQTHDTTNQQMFINDSILAPDAKLSYPQTDIHFVFGGQDSGSSIAQAMEFIPKITAKAAVSVDCVADAPHQIADVQDGAQKIADDLIQRCHQ
jgi:hypothetical protein